MFSQTLASGAISTPSQVLSAYKAKTSGVFQPNSSSKSFSYLSPAESNLSSENESQSANSTPQSWGQAWDDDISVQTSQHSRSPASRAAKGWHHAWDDDNSSSHTSQYSRSPAVSVASRSPAFSTISSAPPSAIKIARRDINAAAASTLLSSSSPAAASVLLSLSSPAPANFLQASTPTFTSPTYSPAYSISSNSSVPDVPESIGNTPVREEGIYAKPMTPNPHEKSSSAASPSSSSQIFNNDLESTTTPQMNSFRADTSSSSPSRDSTTLQEDNSNGTKSSSLSRDGDVAISDISTFVKPKQSHQATQVTPEAFRCKYCKVMGFKERCHSWDSDLSKMPKSVQAMHASSCPRRVNSHDVSTKENVRKSANMDETNDDLNTVHEATSRALFLCQEGYEPLQVAIENPMLTEDPIRGETEDQLDNNNDSHSINKIKSGSSTCCPCVIS